MLVFWVFFLVGYLCDIIGERYNATKKMDAISYFDISLRIIKYLCVLNSLVEIFLSDETKI